MNKGRVSGGILILYNDKFCSIKVLEKSDSFIFLKVNVNKINFILGVVYRPQSIKIQLFIEEITLTLDKLSNVYANCEIILGGDFNCRVAELNRVHKEILENNLNLLPVKNSLDKLSNNNGKSLVQNLELNGFLLLNGRTVSDVLGMYTFL